MPKAKWTGKDVQRVPGVGLFQPGKEVEISDDQARLLRGVNDPGYVITEPKPEKREKEKL